MHAGEVGTREDDGIVNMCAAEELAYGIIAWVEKKHKRSSRTSCVEACDGLRGPVQFSQGVEWPTAVGGA